MHELAIAESLIKIIGEEMAKHNLSKLLKVQIVYGQISAVVPEALETAFEVLTHGTDMAGAIIEMEQKSLQVRCRECEHEFSPDKDDEVFMPCPNCSAQMGHTIISGRELYIDHIEAE